MLRVLDPCRALQQIDNFTSVSYDSGYGSEANYDYMEANHITPYVKYNYFHKEQKRAFREDPFRQENMHYNEDGDYLVCPSGQHMRRVGEHLTTRRRGCSGAAAGQ